jgi:hypothetical protein
MRLLQLTGKVLLTLLLAVLVLELSFRLAGALADSDRGVGSLARDHDVILCVGDSHTWGLGKGYPARLGQRLGNRSPRYHVINMGVAGSNTAQARKRLLGYFERFQPRVLVFWAGVNNKYNRADTQVWQEAGVEQASFFRQLLDSSRVIRFVRLWRNERQLNELLEKSDAYITPVEGKDKVRDTKQGKRIRMRRQILGQDDVFDHRHGDKLSSEEMTRVTELDLRWILAQAKAHGVPAVVVTYPLEGGWFLEANLGIRAAAAAFGVPVVEAKGSLKRLKQQFDRRGQKHDRRTFFDVSVHPTQVLYDAIGDDILRVLDRRGWLRSEGDRNWKAAPPSRPAAGTGAARP